MNWKERIEKAEKKGRFTEKTKHLAGSYTTCAMGERTGGRYDYELTSKGRNLAMDFYLIGVAKDNINQARIIYNKIQRASMKSLVFLGEQHGN